MLLNITNLFIVFKESRTKCKHKTYLIAIMYIPKITALYLDTSF